MSKVICKNPNCKYQYGLDESKIYRTPSGRKTKYDGFCLECLSEKDRKRKQKDKRKYYENNKEKCLARVQDYYLNNKETVLAKIAIYQKKHPNKIKEIQKRFRDNHKDELFNSRRSIDTRYYNAKYFSGQRGYDFTLTIMEYEKLVLHPCYYCNNEFGSTIGMAGIGLDRLNNMLGYVIDNVVSCCEKCNYIRGDILTPRQTKIAIQAILNDIKIETVVNIISYIKKITNFL